MSGTVVDLFTIQIVRADDAVIARPLFLTDPMEEMEENLTDLLPAGYRARIRRWDHQDEPTQEDDDE